MNTNNLFIIPENYPNQFLYGFKKNEIPHIIQFSLLNPKSTNGLWEVKIINVNKINDIEHGKEIQFTESDTKSNNDFINLLEVAFNDFFNKVKIKPKSFIFHLPYKITINNLEIFNTKIKHILIKHFHFKYNQYSFDSNEHKWIYFSLQQNVFKVENLNEIEDIINYLYDHYIQFKSPVNISKLINKDIISQFPDINKTDNNEINNNEIDLKKWIEIFQDYDQLSFQLFSNIVPFKFLYSKSNGLGRFVQNYLLDYSQSNDFYIFTNNIYEVFKELNIKYNEENLDNVENILDQLNSLLNHIPKNNLLNWFISYYTDLTTNLGFKNRTIFITPLFSKSSNLLIPYPEEIIDHSNKDLSYKFYYNANPFKFNKIIQTENPIKNNLINKELDINFLCDNFEKKIIEYKDNISTSNIENYISISKIFNFFIDSLFFPDKITDIFSNKNKTQFILEQFQNIDSYSLGSFLDDLGFNYFCKWMNKLNHFIKKNKEFNINDEFFFNNKIKENQNIFEIINEEYESFEYKQDWNLSESVNYLVSKQSYLEFFYKYKDEMDTFNPYFENDVEMKNSKDYFDEWFSYLFSHPKLKYLYFGDYEDKYNYLISEFNKSKMTDTPIKNILDFNYYIKYIFDDGKYSTTILPSLKRNDSGNPILNNIQFNNDNWNYYIDDNNNSFICKLFKKLLNTLSLKLNISIKKLLSGIDSDEIAQINEIQLDEFYEKIKLLSTEYYIHVDNDTIESFKEILISHLTDNGYFTPIEIQNREIENINSGNIKQFSDKKTLTKEEAIKLFIRLSLWLFQDRPEIRNESFGKNFFDIMIKIIPHEYRNKIENSLSEEDKKELSLLKVFNSKIIDKVSDVELSELLKTHSDKKDYFSQLSKIQSTNLNRYSNSIKKYTSSAYVDINRILRNIETNEYLLSEYFKDILSIFEAFHYTSSLSSENTILYRGSPSDEMLYGKMAGDYIIESGFLSTTFDKQIAKNFSDANYGNIYILYLPKETPILYLSRISTHKLEEEILLPIGSIFKIISIENRRNISDTFQSIDGGFLYHLLYIGNIGSKVLQNIINKTGTEKQYQQQLNDISSGKFLEKTE